MKENHRTSGVIKGESNIAYAFDLPATDKEIKIYLQELCTQFLSFLEKESKKKCNFVRFGGIHIEQHENFLTLSVAFCPFTDREYCPKAYLHLDESGKLCQIQKAKK